MTSLGIDRGMGHIFSKYSLLMASGAGWLAGKGSPTIGPTWTLSEINQYNAHFTHLV